MAFHSRNIGKREKAGHPFRASNTHLLGRPLSPLSSLPGQATLMMVFFLFMGLMLTLVVLEAGHLLIVRGQLQNDADAASTYGAMQLDTAGLRVSNGLAVDVLSPGGDSPAGAYIRQYMADAGYLTAEWSWNWGRCAMQINIARQVPTLFFGFAGVKEAQVKVTGKAKLSNSDRPGGCG